MSTHSTSTSVRGDQQTLTDFAASRLIKQFPDGVILRYEADNDRLEEFILGNPLITYVVINFSDALELINDHESLHNYLSPWQVPFVVATETDEYLQNRTMEDIRTVLAGSAPAIYTPDAGRVYLKKKVNGRVVPRPKEEQMAGLREYKAHVEMVLDEIDEYGWEINILPLAKAMTKEQCRWIQPFFEKHGFTDFAYYTRQYCNHGNHINKLVSHLGNFVQIIEPRNVHAIARLGPNHLKRFPPEVTGASGLKQFLDNCAYDNNRFPEWRSSLERKTFDRNRLGGDN